MSLQHSQNFLHSPRLVRALVSRSSLTPDDFVLEIGPGRGIITAELAQRCRRVRAVEADRRLARRLVERFEGHANVEVCCADFLGQHLPTKRYKVFANLPFNITAAALRKLLDGARHPMESYVVVQRQAASKQLGRPEATLVSVLRHPWYRFEVTHRFRRSDFTPRPAVDACMLRITRRDRVLVQQSQARLYRGFVTLGFRGAKGTLKKNLEPAFGHRQYQRLARDLGFPARASPSELEPAQWVRLFEYFARHADPARRHVIEAIVSGAGRSPARRRSASR